MVSKELKAYIIDFPQMVSTKHPNGQELFERDVNGLILWFTKKYGVEVKEVPVLSEVPSL